MGDRLRPLGSVRCDGTPCAGARELRGRWRLPTGAMGHRGVRREGVPGWAWDPFAGDWGKGLSDSQEFVRIQGHAQVPASFKTADGFRLGSWVSAQRSAMRTRALSPERMALLDALQG